ncbi:MAG: hypothetical protein ABI134_16045, partial [Byssovorax sp.]
SHIASLATSTLTAGRARSVSDRLKREPESPRPWVTVYRPSWILPLRQSSIYIYVLLPTAKTRVLGEAHDALGTADNPARESHAILTATERYALVPIVGLSLSAAVLASGASGWMMMRPQMSSPMVRDPTRTSYAINITNSTVGAVAFGEHSRAEVTSTAPVGTRASGSKNDGY